MLRIREFVPKDIPIISKIVSQSLRENYPPSLYVDIHNRWREGFLVAEWFGTVVGFIAGTMPAPHQARILMLAVWENFRNRGIGSALMDAFMKRCSLMGHKSIELEVRKSNTVAIRFYNRFGFQIVHDLRRFYSDGEDGYKMWRSL